MIRNVIERFATPYDNIYLPGISSLLPNYEQNLIKRFINTNETGINEKLNLLTENNEKMVSITATLTFLAAFFHVYNFSFIIIS